jgi:predicted RND superfamily exporter protein
VHILSNFLQGLHRGVGRRSAMRESLRINLTPVFLTTLTTAIGFLSLNASEAPPFRDLGNMSAMGVALAFLLSIGLLPAVLMVLPLRTPKAPPRGGDAMPRLAGFVVRHRRWLLWSGLAVGLALVAQAPRNVLNDNFVQYFASGNPFREATEFATEHLTGIYTIEYSLPAPGEGGVNEPEYLVHLQAFADWYREQPAVLHVNVLSDTMKRLNKNLHGDQPEWYRLPDERALAAQYLLLYEFSLPFGLDLNNQINVQKSATRMVVTLQTVTTNELLRLESDAQTWLAAHAPDYMQAHSASPALMFAHISYRNIRAMLEGTLVALLLISGVLVFALRSWRTGLLSLVPNLLPIGMGFGVWALLDGQIGLALSVVAAMTLGVVVDDTVHFLSKYLRARRAEGLDPQEAVRYAFGTVGTALWVTTLVLALGFGVLALSDFAMNAEMGLLTAVTILLALLADFLLLPPLLMQFGDKSHAKTAAADRA